MQFRLLPAAVVHAVNHVGFDIKKENARWSVSLAAR